MSQNGKFSNVQVNLGMIAHGLDGTDEVADTRPVFNDSRMAVKQRYPGNLTYGVDFAWVSENLQMRIRYLKVLLLSGVRGIVVVTQPQDLFDSTITHFASLLIFQLLKRVPVESLKQTEHCQPARVVPRELTSFCDLTPVQYLQRSSGRFYYPLLCLALRPAFVSEL